MSGGFFRGTSADQDTRFSNKQAKLLKSQKFAPELEHLVDMSKVQMDAVRPWIAKRVTELLGFEDEVLINFIYSLLEGKEVNGKEVQIALTGFMEKNTGKFMKELWERLLSAQKNASGVPQQDLDAKAEDLRRKKAEDDKLVKDIQKKKDKESNEFERERQRKMDGGFDRKAFDSDVEQSPKHPRSKMSSEKAVDDADVDMRNGFRRKRHSRSTSADRSHSSPRSQSHSISKSLSNSRSYASDRRRSRSVSRSSKHRQRSGSADRVYCSPRKRSTTPRSRHLPRSSLSPPKQRSSFSRRSGSRSPFRSPSLARRKLRSPYRHRSPSPSHRRRSPSPYRRRQSPSLARRRRSPSPTRWYWRRSPPSPRQRRSLSRDHRMSPSPTHYRRSRSPVRHRRSPSLARHHRSPSPARRRRSPYPARRRSSPYRRDRPLPSYKYRRPSSPYQRGRSQSPVRSSKSFSPGKSLSPVSPVRISPAIVSPLIQRRFPSASRSDSPVTSPDRRPSPSTQKRYQRSPPKSCRSLSHMRHISHTSRRRNSISPAKGRSSSPSPSLSPIKQISSKECRSLRMLDLSPGPRQPSSARFKERSAGQDESLHESPVRQKMEPMAQEGILSPKRKGREPEDHKSSHRLSKDEANRSRELSGKGVCPRTPDKQRSIPVQDSVVDEKGSVPKHSDEKGSAELNIPQKHNAQGSDEHNEAETASLLVEKINRNNNSFYSESEESDKHKRKRKHKHKRSGRKEVSSDDSYDSDLDDRKEAKRRKKEEKRLRREERRRRREERRRRREERRAEKLKMKDRYDSDISDGEHTVRKSHRSNDEEAESEQKKLEIELRQKALESLKAKKGIGC